MILLYVLDTFFSVIFVAVLTSSQLVRNRPEETVSITIDNVDLEALPPQLPFELLDVLLFLDLVKDRLLLRALLLLVVSSSKESHLFKALIHIDLKKLIL